MLAFQVILILSGNLSFLNWLTIVPIARLLRRRASRAACCRAAARATRCARGGDGGAVARAAPWSPARCSSLVVACSASRPVREPALRPAGDEHVVRPARPGQHLRRLRQRRPRARRDRLRGHRRRRARRRRRLARVRVPVQAGRPDAAAVLDRALPLPPRLADVVRRHARAGARTRGRCTSSGSSCTADPGVLGPARQRSLPRHAAALHPGDALPLSLRAARRSGRRLVDARALGTGCRRSPSTIRGCGASSSPTTGPSTTGPRPARASRVRCRAATRAPRDRRPSCGSGRPAPSSSSTAGRRWRSRRAGPSSVSSRSWSRAVVSAETTHCSISAPVQPLVNFLSGSRLNPVGVDAAPAEMHVEDLEPLVVERQVDEEHLVEAALADHLGGQQVDAVGGGADEEAARLLLHPGEEEAEDAAELALLRLRADARPRSRRTRPPPAPSTRACGTPRRTRASGLPCRPEKISIMSMR